MIDPGTGIPRAVRAGALVSAATSLGAFAHQHAGGAAPSGRLLLALVAVTALVAVPASARRLRTRTVAPLLLLDQLLVHLLLPRGAATAGDVVVSHHASATHVTDGVVATGLTWQMLGAHLLAALVVGLAWSKGEALLWRVAERLAPPVLPRRSPVAPSVGAFAPLRSLRDRWRYARPPARGPPTVSVSA